MVGLMSFQFRWLARVVGVTALATAACTGTVGPSGVESQGNGSLDGSAGTTTGTAVDPDAGGGNGTGVGSGDPNAAGSMVLRHLTQFEYLNTVRDLLGDTSLLPDQVPSEPLVARVPGGLPQTGLIDANTAQHYQGAAEALAVNAAKNLATLLPCAGPATGAAAGAGDACATQFVNTFGQKAYRRPLSPDEATALVALYHKGLAAPLNLAFNDAIGLVIEAILQSPGFLYHWEIGPAPTVHVGATILLDGYAIANRLSYFLWGTMPDDALFAGAAQNQLNTPDAVTAQALRMLKDPRARPAVANFFEAWLGMRALFATPKDTTVYARYDITQQTDMDTEFRTFVTSVVFDRSGKFPELLTSTRTEVNQDLASIYGLSNVVGTQPRPATLDSTQRSGLLTLAAFLAYNGDPATSNPVHRGHAIYTQFLCGGIPPPPNNVPPPAPPTAAGTTRDHFAQHDSQACASGCHALMDPYGFPFEHFDGIGQYRTTDNNLPVDSTSTAVIDGQRRSIANATELSAALAQSDQVHQCFATQWLRFALSRMESPEDLASLQSAQQTFANSQYDVRQMLVGIATSRTFRYRTPAMGEVLP